MKYDWHFVWDCECLKTLTSVLKVICRQLFFADFKQRFAHVFLLVKNSYVGHLSY